MNLRYAAIKDPGLKIEIAISGIVVAEVFITISSFLGCFELTFNFHYYYAKVIVWVAISIFYFGCLHVILRRKICDLIKIPQILCIYVCTYCHIVWDRNNDADSCIMFNSRNLHNIQTSLLTLLTRDVLQGDITLQDTYNFLKCITLPRPSSRKQL